MLFKALLKCLSIFLLISTASAEEYDPNGDNWTDGLAIVLDYTPCGYQPFEVISDKEFFDPGQKWPSWKKRNITYRLYNSGYPERDRYHFRRAFDRWSSVTPLIFQEVLWSGPTPTHEVDIDIVWYDREHLDYPVGDYKFVNVTGHVFPPDPHLIGRGDIHLNMKWRWKGADTFAPMALHMIGHALGLPHGDKDISAMYPRANPHEFPTEQDVKRIQYLYGRR